MVLNTPLNAYSSNIGRNAITLCFTNIKQASICLFLSLRQTLKIFLYCKFLLNIFNETLCISVRNSVNIQRKCAVPHK